VAALPRHKTLSAGGGRPQAKGGGGGGGGCWLLAVGL